MVDEFVIYDIVQYTKNDWRNRNKIKTQNGPQWITIPVRQSSLNQTVQDTQISFPKWKVKHWNTLKTNYSKAPFFSLYKERFENLYLGCNNSYLSDINLKFIKNICSILGITTKITTAKNLELVDGQTERLVEICKLKNAQIYLSGPAANSYLDKEIFNSEGIHIEWMDYSHYPVYDQLFPPFEHAVSILDLIFSVGPSANKYMKSFR